MEAMDYLQAVLALVFVLALIGVIAALARRAGFGYPMRAIKPTGPRRLSVVEVTPLDARRRLVLVRRDDVEHLLVLGPTSELVVERDINAKPDFADEVRQAVANDTPHEGGER